MADQSNDADGALHLEWVEDLLHKPAYKTEHEIRRLQLIEATVVRQQISQLAVDVRKPNEAAIELYIANLRSWERGRGVYPYPPGFLPASLRSLASACDALDLKSKRIAGTVKRRKAGPGDNASSKVDASDVGVTDRTA